MTQRDETLLSGTWNVLGVLIEFLAKPADTQTDTALVRGTMQGGLTIPLHSHASQELIYVVAGSLEVFTDGRGWRSASTGEVVVIPGNQKHALRNITTRDVTTIAFTGSDLYYFFRELAVPADPIPSSVMTTPTSEQLRKLIEANAKYGCWLGSPEENAAIGISLPD